LRNNRPFGPTAFDERRRVTAGGQLGKECGDGSVLTINAAGSKLVGVSRSLALWRNTTLLEKEKANPPVLVPPLKTVAKRFLLTIGGDAMKGTTPGYNNKSAVSDAVGNSPGNAATGTSGKQPQ
jgi:hypothetical protein